MIQLIFEKDSERVSALFLKDNFYSWNRRLENLKRVDKEIYFCFPIEVFPRLISELSEISKMDIEQKNGYDKVITTLQNEDVDMLYFVPSFSETQKIDLFELHSIRGWVISSLLQFNDDDVRYLGLAEIINFWYDWIHEPSVIPTLESPAFSDTERVALLRFWTYCDREVDNLPDNDVVGDLTWVRLCEQANITVDIFLERGRLTSIDRKFFIERRKDFK